MWLTLQMELVILIPKDIIIQLHRVGTLTRRAHRAQQDNEIISIRLGD
jgi:hypothetical protein